jgi:SAM-dependent methyltransferase
VLSLQAAAAAATRALSELDERTAARGRSIEAVRDDLTRLSLRESIFQGDAADVASLQRVYTDVLRRRGPMTEREFVDAAYRIVLRRAPDADGRVAGEAELSSGLQSRGAFVAALVASTEYAALRELEDSISRSRHGPMRGLRASARTDERQIEIPWVLSRVGRARRVLDVGYAYAREPYLEALVALAVDELVGVDLAERDVPGMRSVVADLRALPFDDGAFDVVLCVSTLEHVGWDNSIYGQSVEQDSSGMLTALRELRRVTVPAGRILMTVPCGVEEHHGWLVQRSPSSWRQLFESAALHIAEQETYELRPGGWRTVDGDPDVHYGERGPAASAVLCAVLTR